MYIINKDKPGYKHTPMGWIPVEWNVKRLGDICAHFKSGFGITSDIIHDKGEFPVYGGNGLRGYTITYTHDGNYLLIGRQGALCGNIQRISGKTYVSEHAIAVQTNGVADLNFLGYKLEFQNLNRLSESSAQPGLSVEKLIRLRIDLPTIAEQRKIAAILSTWDEAITKTQQLIAQLKKRNKGLMQQLLKGKKRLKGFEGVWKKITIGDIISESRIPSINNNPNKRITVRLNQKGIVKREVRGTEAEEATYYFVRKVGQFIYGKQNLHKGAFGIIPNELHGFESSQDIPAFDFKAGFYPSFFLFYIGQENIYLSLEKYATGTGSKRIHPENLFKVHFEFPLYEEQQAIAKILDTAVAELELFKLSLSKLKQQKKGLIQKLLTGEVRVKIDKI